MTAEIVQIGTPAELFERPSHTFVGYFIGSPGMNVLPAKIDGSNVTLGDRHDRARLPPAASPPTRGPNSASARNSSGSAARACPSRIRKVEDIGRHKIVRAEFAGKPIAIVVPEDGEIPADPRVSFDPVRHQHLRQFLARRQGGLIHGKDLEQQGLVHGAAGACCWSRSRR